VRRRRRYARNLSFFTMSRRPHYNATSSIIRQRRYKRMRSNRSCVLSRRSIDTRGHVFRVGANVRRNRFRIKTKKTAYDCRTPYARNGCYVVRRDYLNNPFLRGKTSILCAAGGDTRGIFRFLRYLVARTTMRYRATSHTLVLYGT